MHLNLLQHRYALSKSDIDVLATAMIKNSNLDQAAADLDHRLPQEAIYVVARAMATEIFGEPLDEVCPAMVAQRQAQTSACHQDWLAERKRRQEERRAQERAQDLAWYEEEKLMRMTLG